MPVKNPRIKTDIFLVGEGVQLASDGVDGFGDGRGRTPLRSFEEKVLNEVGYASVAVCLEAGTAFQPDPYRNGVQIRHHLRSDD